MKRLELFEFEDFGWLPNTIRSGVTNLIKVLHGFMGTSEVLVNLIKQSHERVAFDQITDLGSGAGGPMIDVVGALNSESDNTTELLLTDKYPNKKAVDNINGLAIPFVKYHAESVDAAALDKAPDGLKTMVASFHHMSPEVAKRIVTSAQENREPILIYEIAENNVPFIVWLLLLPISLTILFLMSWAMTPFVRPLTATQLIFTYLIPIIPIIYAWDGQASLMRTYTFNDLKSLIGNDQNPGFNWEMAVAKRSNGKKAGYYVLGWPG
ncbi:MAG: hypothetical protein AAF705_11535 [Bacteroidota bacterium]